MPIGELPWPAELAMMPSCMAGQAVPRDVPLQSLIAPVVTSEVSSRQGSTAATCWQHEEQLNSRIAGPLKC
jgi:hypothetical protein